MLKLHVTILMLLVMPLGGCVNYWYQEGKSFDQCKADIEQCRAELAKYSDLTNIGSYERKFVEDCMKTKGYNLVTGDKLPMKAKREDPDTSLYWRLNGVAGRID